MDSYSFPVSLSQSLPAEYFMPEQQTLQRAQMAFPSPLDRLRTEKRERAARLGLSHDQLSDSFEGNLSYPKSVANRLQDVSTPVKSRPVDRLKLNDNDGGMNDVSFSRSASRGSFLTSPALTVSLHQSLTQSLDQSLTHSWIFNNFSSLNESINGGPPPSRPVNPNKAIITIDAVTRQVLTFNDVACELFGYRDDQLSNKKLSDLLNFKGSDRSGASSDVELDERSGLLLQINGKIMEAKQQDGCQITVSVWTRQSRTPNNTSIHEGGDTRSSKTVLVVMEPVQKLTASCVINSMGEVTECGEAFSLLHGFLVPPAYLQNTSADEKPPNSIYKLLPGIILPSAKSDVDKPLDKLYRKQAATAVTYNGSTLPVSLLMDRLHQSSEEVHYRITEWIMTSLSGLVSIRDDGTIHSINQHLSLFLCGYTPDELQDTAIQNLLFDLPMQDYHPSECSGASSTALMDSGSMPLPTFDDDDGVKELEELPTLPALETPNAVQRINSIGSQPDIIPSDPPVTSTPSQPVRCETADLLNAATEAVRNLDITGKTESPLLDLERATTVDLILANPLDPKDSSGVITWPSRNVSSCDDDPCPLYSPQKKPTNGCAACKAQMSSSTDRKESLNHSHSPTEPALILSNSASGAADLPDLLSPPHNLALDSVSSTPARPRDMPSTPARSRSRHKLLHNVEISSHFLKMPQEGGYPCQLKHKNGEMISVIVQCRRVELHDGTRRSCLWISQDPSDIVEAAKQLEHLTLQSTHNETRFNSEMESSHAISESNHVLTTPGKSPARLVNSMIQEQSETSVSDPEPGELEQTINLSMSQVFEKSKLRAASSLSGPGTDSPDKAHDSQLDATPCLDETIEFPPADGLYRQAYRTTLSVGKGAFGFVKLALRRSDQEEFVVKFIRKSKVLKDSWVCDDEMGDISMEIALLAKLDHPNIVKLVDVYENSTYFQLVMEKHGSGMDLFEFIERQPNLDEKLASHIFRQVVSGVAYLHSLNILHRDIKDENIILNEEFSVKIIDFGSAAFMHEGQVFSTFCGTIEYASPEILLGNKYRGPELEVWSMGVTLFTLIYSENPFYDVEETIEAVLKPPFLVSTALMQLIQWMLHPDPKFRASIEQVQTHKWITQTVLIERYSWEEVLPNNEFRGNVAADNRPDPLESSHNSGHSSQSSSADQSDDEKLVRTEMIRYLDMPDPI